MADLEKFAQVAGPAAQSLGTLAEGRNAYAVGEFQARQLRQSAGQERAVASRAVAEEARKSRFMASSARAAFAGSGNYDAEAQALAEGEHSALTALYSGEERARGLDLGAKSSLLEGSLARGASRMDALTPLASNYDSIAKASKSLYEKYR